MSTASSRGWHGWCATALLSMLAACATKQPTVSAAKAGYSVFRELAWSDEFNYSGLPDSTRWGYDVGGSGWGNKEAQFYTKAQTRNARVEDGHLIIEAHHEAVTSANPYSSARLVSRGEKGRGGSLTYGRVEVRAQLPAARGIWPAIWMLPDERPYGNHSWPDNGEIDIMEYVGYRPAIVQASTHCRKYYFRTNNQKTDSIRVADATTAYHVYALEWTPDSIRAFVDGRAYFTATNEHSGWQAWPWDQPFHLVLNVAVGGEWGGRHGIDTAAFPQRMLIDYVRFYRLARAGS